MSSLESCFFCGEANPQCLEEHHLVPKSFGSDPETVKVCANCHRKLHYVLRKVKAELPNEEVQPSLAFDTGENEKLKQLHEKLKQLLELIEKLEADSGSANLHKLLEISGLEKEELDRLIKYALREGLLYTPDGNSVKRARR